MKISLIIPVLNERAGIAQSISRLRMLDADEVLFVDGGSTDGTVELIEAESIPLVRSEPGRGCQLRCGADSATGELLLFLHADNWLEPDAINQLRSSPVSLSHLWGGFEQRIEHPAGKYRWLEWGNRWRARCLGMVYGDQGLFVSRLLYDRVGGFPDQPLMEDYELSRRLKRNTKPIILPGPIHISPRRWESRGVLRQTVKNWSIVFRYRLGQSPEHLAKVYRRHDQPE